MSLQAMQARETLAKSRRRPLYLGFDFHSHLLPRVDDGMESLADARRAIAAMKMAGFAGAVITPHIYQGLFDNDVVSLRTAFAAFAAALQSEGEDFQLQLAAEYFADEHLVELIKRDELLSLAVGNERWVLVEFPYFQETPFAGICLSALVARGYRPIVAHVERYRFVARTPHAWLDRFARMNAILQGDIGSLAGQHGEAVRQFSKWLLARDLVPLWGTDIHRAEQMERFILPGLKLLRGLGQLNMLLTPMTQRLPATALTTALTNAPTTSLTNA